MLHVVWDWRADGLGCVQSVERRRVILKELSYAAQVLPTAWTLKLSVCQLLGFRKRNQLVDGKDGRECGRAGYDYIDMHQLFHDFCRKKEMIELDKNEREGKKNERQKHL